MSDATGRRAAADYRVRGARLTDVPRLAAVEVAAAARFADIGLPRIARGRPTSEAEYRAAVAAGRLWVVEDAAETVVGLAIADRVDGEGYLAEIAVHPDHAGRRLAARMIKAVAAWAAEQGYRSLSLTTFRDVPWNRPYYLRLGFSVVEEAEAGPELRAIRAGERKRGLDKLSPRLCMRRNIEKET
ncbi:MAG: GNAT family N-acetyltransferase [Kiloniellaceae bacterium]